MDSFYEELKKKLEDYFANTSREQILKDLKRVAGKDRDWYDKNDLDDILGVK